MLDGIEMDENLLLENGSKKQELEIVFEDDAIIIVNKPPEFLSVPGKEITDSVYTRIKEKYPNATGPLIVHRLDMPTSGILVLTKTKEANKILQSQFIKRTIKKRYVALLDGNLTKKSGTINLPLRLDIDDRPRQLVDFTHGKNAKTAWQVIEQKDNTTRIHFYPITGRTHQLRVHAAHKDGLNAPIIGDDLYGKKQNRLHLHAEFIEFIHPSTKESLDKLKSFGNILIPATSGELASGLVGEGRMAEPEDIVSFIENDILSKLPLKGKKVLITAGPTYEAIDPVRFIGNHSSGKMGFAIANSAANLGAEVILISGPSHQQIKHSLVKRIDVVSADDMYKVTHQYFNDVDIAILSAAVADYKPKNIANQKIKKKDSSLTIELSPTKDILASLGKIKKDQYLVGFALETNNEIENAKSKIKRKNLDAIVLNSLQDKGAGFATDTNKITIIDKNLNEKPFELKSKVEVAKDILNEIVEKLT